MFSSPRTHRKNNKLYPNEVQILTEPKAHLSKTKKKHIWVLGEEIYWFDSSKKKRSKVAEDTVPQQVADSSAPLEVASLQPVTEGKKAKKDEGDDKYIIVGFDTEYVGTKLQRVKTIDSNKKIKSRGWIPYTDYDGDTELSDKLINIDPEENPNWESDLKIVDSKIIQLKSGVVAKEYQKLTVKNKLLSYQFWAKTSDGEEWNGICIPEEEEKEFVKKDGTTITVTTVGRLTLANFLIWVLGEGKRNGHVQGKLPYQVFLVGHFTRADLCMFKDFQRISKYLTTIRNTFTTESNTRTDYIPIKIKESSRGGRKEAFEIHVSIRDTMLLTPTAKKSLRAIGEMLQATEDEECKKDPSRVRENFEKLDLKALKLQHPKHGVNVYEDMEWVRDNHWIKFREYAIQDCFIVVRYLEQLMKRYYDLTKSSRIPVTLSSIGVDLMIKQWNEAHPLETGVKNRLLGREVVERLKWTPSQNGGGYYKPETGWKPIDELEFKEPLIIKCFHGGRNEQFWFGPGSVGEWTDWDLSSCYPTAMSIIGTPDFKSVKYSLVTEDYLNPSTLGFMWVDFDFTRNRGGVLKDPADYPRYPVLPVRTNTDSLIFPLRGQSYCTAPEFFLAYEMGAYLKIKDGYIIESNPDEKIFGEFVKRCVLERNRYKQEKKALDELFWKELCNATYGKTAQGLRGKTAYNVSKNRSETLPPSKITNPTFAAFITGYARATLGEIMNSLPRNRCVFSCTTDGFLCDATDKEIEKAQKGRIASEFLNASIFLKGDKGSVLEVKHRIKQPLGWKTRGQATLIEGDATKITQEGEVQPDYSKRILLAKSSIKLPKERILSELPASEKLINNEIVELFLNRSPDTSLYYTPATSTKEMINSDTDLITKTSEKTINMEFDFKRLPKGVTEVEMIGHLNPVTTGQFHQLSGAPLPQEWHSHLVFSTNPTLDVTQYNKVRAIWEQYSLKKGGCCLKTVEDLQKFAHYLNVQAPWLDHNNNGAKTHKPELSILRRVLTWAIVNNQAGFVFKTKKQSLTPTEWSKLLTDTALECKLSFSDSLYSAFQDAYSLKWTDQTFRDINKSKKRITLNSIPATTEVLAFLEKLKLKLIKRCPESSNIDIKALTYEKDHIYDEPEINRARLEKTSFTPTPSKCELIQNLVTPEYQPADFLKVDYSRILKAEVKEYERIRSGKLTLQESQFRQGLLDAVDSVAKKLERMKIDKTLKAPELKYQQEMIKVLTTPTPPVQS
jgi:hypothetical protein